ncbi:pyridoxal phosphate-dependent transferase [Chloropicon primus]|uniref:Pyridoxal phosphate-dependent transferase n=1 Tax=Chloropicon primus TaxID=1764295 RepID=A0A5B8MY79_9CHLO|nr:pyridoxal phosphate-dependent transferase [Chloropicon primus]UPR03760.1 pyridoxal phosphate-dependent transferase [Chloropicon primus]|mmetsp:Transcript_7947/g.22761  ORF Transcript_7947/g.22761 Transcript_7947/m.22761 type:complete len:465 (+) Transcript_7947:257-1651(+)|eukprot:QDZ24552.1 pyridoxal phosphate-dependent transferase [Chloropicon primus]
MRGDCHHLARGSRVVSVAVLRQSSRNGWRRRIRLSSCSCSYSSELYEVGSTAERLKPSTTVAISDLATEMKREGKDVISLAPGEPDFDTPQRIALAGQNAIGEGKTKYSPNAGVADLREAIVRKLERENGISGLSASKNIVVTNGAKQAIAETILAACSPGDEVIVPSPYWVSYPEMARLAGADPVIVETKLEDNFLLTAEGLESALTEKSRILILCSPSNPTGGVYTKKDMQAIAKVVASHERLLVISDEIYEHIYYKNESGDAEDDAFPCSFASCGVEGAQDRTITVNGFSKSFAMTGWRVGYLAAPEPLASAAAKVQSQFTSGASSLAQYAACEALLMCEEEENEGLRGGEEVQAMVKEFRKRRDYVCERLEKIGGTRLPGGSKPQGAFYLFPDVSSWIEGTGSKSSDELCMRILREAGVATVPGSAFGKEECLRMSYATSMENLERALDKIEEWLGKNVK